MKTKAATCLFAILLMVAGCGAGGGDEFGGTEFYQPPLYGAIAVDQVLGGAAIVSNHDSQRSANDAALLKCGAGCTRVLEFDSNKCGALARATNTATFGWASNSSSHDAKVTAIQQCAINKGVGCQVVLDACNDA